MFTKWGVGMYSLDLIPRRFYSVREPSSSSSSSSSSSALDLAFVLQVAAAETADRLRRVDVLVPAKAEVEPEVEAAEEERVLFLVGAAV